MPITIKTNVINYKDPTSGEYTGIDAVGEGITFDAEAYAKGTRDGVAVTSGDPAYNKNSKYYSEQAAASAADAAAFVGAPRVAATAAAMTDTSKVYVYTGSENGYTAGNWYYHNGSSWTSGGVYNSTALNTDKSLSIENMAADAKAVGDLKDDLSEITGLSDEIKEALLACFAHVAWVDDDGQDYYDALETALGITSWKVINRSAYGYGPITPIGYQESIYVVSINNEITARCMMVVPVKNVGYVFSVVDTTKYNLAMYDTTDDVLKTYNAERQGQPVQIQAYDFDGASAPSWVDSQTAVGNYVACSFKKLDGTDFTEQEIENAYGTIFTVETIQAVNNVSIGMDAISGTQGQSYVAHDGGNTVNSRCRLKVPLKNNNNTYTVVDSAKYNLALYPLLNNISEEYTFISMGQSYTVNAYEMSGDSAPSWKTSETSNADYVWLSFKKLDGTDFTEQEINNIYGSIFTIS